MRVCCICAEKVSDVSPENYGYCSFCNEEVYTIETTEIITNDIDFEIFDFGFLDLLTQIDLIIDSKGSHKEKLSKLKLCIENEYWRLN